MKKIFYSLISGLAIAALLGGCNKFNDQFEGLDDMTKPTNVASLNYTLTAADYATMKTAALANATTDEEIAAANAIGTSLAFNSTFGAADYVPAVLNKMYYSFDMGSSVMLTYNYDEGVIPYLADYTSAQVYKTVDADYETFGGLVGAIKYFVPSFMPEEGIPDILDAQITAPVADQLVLVEYRYSDTEPANSGPKAVQHLLNDFEAYANYDPITLDGWKSVETEGVRTWQARVYGDNAYAQYTSYNSGELNESYLVSPTVDLTGSEQNTLTFDVNIGYWKNDGLKVFLSENYDGVNFDAATWVDVSSNFTIPSEPVSGYGLFPNAGEMDLSAYKGKLTVAFKYTGNGIDNSETTTYQIDNVLIEGITYLDAKKNTSADYEVYNAYYKFNGSSWSKATGVYALSISDYDAMGTASGQPGKYNNFDSSMPPENYLPTLLANLFPYAQNGNKQIVVYKYYSGGTQTRADEYVFENGVWYKPSSIIERSEQFVYTTSGWLFDPTVNVTMATADYQMMVDYVLATPEIAVFAHPFYKNEEYYWGFSSRYSNVNFRLSYRNPYFTGDYIQDPSIDAELSALTTDAEKVALMYERLKGGMAKFLQLKYPEAVPNVSGIDVYYFATTYIYYPTGIASGYEYREYEFKCTAAASGSNPPTFEYISDKIVN